MYDCDLRLQDAGLELSSDQCFSFMEQMQVQSLPGPGRALLELQATLVRQPRHEATAHLREDTAFHPQGMWSVPHSGVHNLPCSSETVSWGIPASV